jgi:hypothetical protein
MMAANRIAVAKTYQIYIGGKFPRTESGRYFTLEDKRGNVIANLCRGSRKDFRNSVASSHFNFSVLEPTGVVSILSSDDSSLLGLITNIAAAARPLPKPFRNWRPTTSSVLSRETGWTGQATPKIPT